MRRIKKYNLLCACVLVISAVASISVSAGMAKRKVTPVTRHGTAETIATTQAVNQQEDKNSKEKSNIITDKGVYHLSENSKYRPYLWKNADGSAPDYKAYVFEPAVYEEFSKNFKSEDIESIFREDGENHFRLSLWKANEIVLKEAGVLPENIFTSNICTACNPDLLYSHRIMGDIRGNMAAFLALK